MTTGGKQWKGTWTGEVEVDRASEQVDVGRLKQDGRAGGWQPEPSMGGSGWGRAPIADLQN